MQKIANDVKLGNTATNTIVTGLYTALPTVSVYVHACDDLKTPIPYP